MADASDMAIESPPDMTLAGVASELPMLSLCAGVAAGDCSA